MSNLPGTGPPTAAAGTLPERTSVDVYGPPPQALADLAREAGGRWVIWFGFATRRWWAMPRKPYWPGWVEAHTPVGLLERIREVDAYHGVDHRPAARAA